MYVEVIVLKKLLVRILLFSVVYFCVKILMRLRARIDTQKNIYSIRAAYIIFLFYLIIGHISALVSYLIVSSRNIPDEVFFNYKFYDPFFILFPHLIMIYIFYLFVKRYPKLNFKSFFYQKTYLHNLVKWLSGIFLVFFPLYFTFFKLGIDYNMLQNITINFIAYPLLSFIIIGLIVPISEELIFIGIIYNSLKEKINIFWAIIMSSFLFSIFHTDIHLAAFIVYFISTVVYCFCYEKSKTLFVPIVLHSLFNSVNILYRTKPGISFATSLNNIIVFVIIAFAFISFFVIRYTKFVNVIASFVAKRLK